MIFVLAGCGRQGHIQKDPEKSTPPEPRQLHSMRGSTTMRKIDDPREIVWFVEWQSADLNFVTEKDYSGRMNGVSGAIYDEGRRAGTFTAEEAQAYKESDRLTLSGNVTLIAETPLSGHVTPKAGTPKSVLTCEQLEWDVAEDVVKARMNVNMDTSDYKIGPFTEVWCTPGLDLWGTPELFRVNSAARDKLRAIVGELFGLGEPFRVKSAARDKRSHDASAL